VLEETKGEPSLSTDGQLVAETKFKVEDSAAATRSIWPKCNAQRMVVKSLGRERKKNGRTSATKSKKMKERN